MGFGGQEKGATKGNAYGGWPNSGPRPPMRPGHAQPGAPLSKGGAPPQPPAAPSGKGGKSKGQDGSTPNWAQASSKAAMATKHPPMISKSSSIPKRPFHPPASVPQHGQSSSKPPTAMEAMERLREEQKKKDKEKRDAESAKAKPAKKKEDMFKDGRARFTAPGQLAGLPPARPERPPNLKQEQGAPITKAGGGGGAYAVLNSKAAGLRPPSPEVLKMYRAREAHHLNLAAKSASMASADADLRRKKKSALKSKAKPKNLASPFAAGEVIEISDSDGDDDASDCTPVYRDTEGNIIPANAQIQKTNSNEVKASGSKSKKSRKPDSATAKFRDGDMLAGIGNGVKLQHLPTMHIPYQQALLHGGAAGPVDGNTNRELTFEEELLGITREERAEKNRPATFEEELLASSIPDLVLETPVDLRNELMVEEPIRIERKKKEEDVNLDDVFGDEEEVDNTPALVIQSPKRKPSYQDELLAAALAMSGASTNEEKTPASTKTPTQTKTRQRPQSTTKTKINDPPKVASASPTLLPTSSSRSPAVRSPAVRSPAVRSPAVKQKQEELELKKREMLKRRQEAARLAEEARKAAELAMAAADAAMASVEAEAEELAAFVEDDDLDQETVSRNEGSEVNDLLNAHFGTSPSKKTPKPKNTRPAPEERREAKIAKRSRTDSSQPKKQPPKRPELEVEFEDPEVAFEDPEVVTVIDPDAEVILIPDDEEAEPSVVEAGKVEENAEDVFFQETEASASEAAQPEDSGNDAFHALLLDM